MTDYTKEILEKYQVRKTKKQKNRFIGYMQSVCKDLGYEMKLEKGQLGARNIVIGDVDSAKVIYGAHYDTAPALPFPNLLTPKNMSVYMLYVLAIAAGAFALFFGIGFLTAFFLRYLTTDRYTFVFAYNIIQRGIFLVLVALMLLGPANKHTVNDNTSGVVTLVEIMNALPPEKRAQTCFVFFDLEEMGLFGSQSFNKNHKNALKNKLVLNFDCVSDGRNMLFATKKKSRVFAEALKKAFPTSDAVDCEIAERFVFYPSDNISFPLGVGVAAFNKTKHGILYVGRIHTKRDLVFRSENIEFLKEGAVGLVDLI